MVLKKVNNNSSKNISRKIMYPKLSRTYYDFFFISILLIIDRLTKLFSSNLTAPIDYKLLEITFVKNTGAGFSLFNNMNTFLAIFASIIGIILTYYYIKQSTSKDKKKNQNEIYVPRFSFITILSGTIGNLVDRIFFGGVIDFINFRFFPIFNFSDILISIGVGYWIIILIKEK